MRISKSALLITLAIFFTQGAALHSQTDKFMFHGGFCYDFYSLRPRFGAAGEGFILPFYGLTGGFNYVLMHSNDQLSVMANPNVALAYSGGAGANFMVQAPIFLALRYGAGATPYNEKKIGLGLGIGGSLNYLYSTSFIPALNHTFAIPKAYGELSVNGRNSFYTFRVHWTLSKATQKWGGSDYSFSNFGLAVIYSF